jgi:hypothetical protein
MAKLLSFDIDGTLEIGEPPGPITVDMVRRAKELGYLVGSCSDRPSGLQRQMWEQLGIAADFTVQKHKMADIRTLCAADEYLHVGTADRDNHYTALSGFKFLPAYSTTDEPWMRDAAGHDLERYTQRLSQTERARVEGTQQA